eukprot:scaffold3999_cov101-Isochrysis_galbana.AAC.2
MHERHPASLSAVSRPRRPNVHPHPQIVRDRQQRVPPGKLRQPERLVAADAPAIRPAVVARGQHVRRARRDGRHPLGPQRLHAPWSRLLHMRCAVLAVPQGRAQAPRIDRPLGTEREAAVVAAGHGRHHHRRQAHHP